MKKIKFSEQFERDYNWYFKWRNTFNFDSCSDYSNKKGDSLIILSEDGYTAKECFYTYDSKGKIISCKEPDLYKEILRCKGSINFNIKMWAESRASGDLPKILFLEIIKEYELLDWMVDSVEMQKFKFPPYTDIKGHVESINKLINKNKYEVKISIRKNLNYKIISVIRKFIEKIKNIFRN